MEAGIKYTSWSPYPKYETTHWINGWVAARDILEVLEIVKISYPSTAMNPCCQASILHTIQTALLPLKNQYSKENNSSGTLYNTGSYRYSASVLNGSTYKLRTTRWHNSAEEI